MGAPSLLTFALVLAGCGAGQPEPASVGSEAFDRDGEAVDLCPMLDSSAADFCDTYRVVSLIAPGPLTDVSRPDAEVRHGSGSDAVEGGRAFSGLDNDVVLTDVDDPESDALNPAGRRFVYQVWLTLDQQQLRALAEADKPSWNVMQRGFADSAGGQWKLSLVTRDNGDVAAQCVVRDDNGNVLRAHSGSKFEAGVEAAVSCLFDDAANTLIVVVNKESGDVDRASTAEFGDVAPHDDRSDCWKAVADQIAVGNKPVCDGSTLTDDDRFQGVIRQARVLKLAGG